MKPHVCASFFYLWVFNTGKISECIWWNSISLYCCSRMCSLTLSVYTLLLYKRSCKKPLTLILSFKMELCKINASFYKSKQLQHKPKSFSSSSVWYFTVTHSYTFSTKFALVLQPVSIRIFGSSVLSIEPACVSNSFERNPCKYGCASNCVSTDYLFFFFSILPFKPVEYDTPTDVVTVRTPTIFWFQLGTHFSGS